MDYETLAEIPGWFFEIDYVILGWALRDQAAAGITGNLAEIGVYEGRSTVAIGQHWGPNERFTVVDLFEEAAPTDANQRENRRYAGLQQVRFELNVRRHLGRVPEIVRGTSANILNHAEPGTHRFVHVDGSHLYDQVRTDARSARRLLAASGMVCFDDYCRPFLPGAAAAVWETVFRDGLRAIVVTENKFYGTFGDPGPVQERLIAWLATSPRWEFEIQSVASSELVRVFPRGDSSSPTRWADRSRSGPTSQSAVGRL